MTTTDTTVNNLIINTMTQAQYATITPSSTELYMVTDATLSSTDVTTALGYTPYNSTNPNGYITNSAIANMQTTTNLVTSVSSSSTDAQYPSAKLFYDTVGDIETALNTINSGS